MIEIEIEKLKEYVAKEHEENIEYISYINKLLKNDNSNDESLELIIKLLDETKENYVVMKQLMKNTKVNGYFEILRANIELLMTIKFFLKDKKNLHNKIKAYEYFQMKNGIKLQKKNLKKSEDEFIKWCQEYNYSLEEGKSLYKKMQKDVLANIEIIKTYLKDEKYVEIQKKVERKKIQNFYTLYNESEPTNFGELCRCLGEQDIYTSTYDVTSQIIHASNLRLKNDEQFLWYTTVENNNLLYFILKEVIINFLNEEDVLKLKEWGKKRFGINFIDND